MRTVFTPKMLAEAKDRYSKPATTPWYIVIDTKYTDRDAAVIQAFITSLLNASSKEVTDGQAD